MVSDTEEHAEADKAGKNLIEELNQTESVCVNTEKVQYSLIVYLSILSKYLPQP